MSNILILHSGLNGISNACLEIARRLENRKHKTFTASVKNIRSKIESNGLEYFILGEITTKYKISNTSKLINPFSHKNHLKTIFESAYSRLEFESLEKFIDRNKIDLLLIDMELHEYIMYSAVNQIPFILINQWFSVWEAENNLPLSSAKFVSNALQQKLIWKLKTCAGYIKTKSSSFKHLRATRKNFLEYLAKQLNFDRKELLAFRFPLPYIYKTYPVLSMTHPDLEFNAKTRASLSYVFPCVAAKRTEAISDHFTRDLQFIIENKSQKEKNVIVVTQTTMKQQSKNYKRKLLRVLASLDNSISIVSLGKDFQKYKEFDNQKNVFLYERIPQMQALNHADLSINHGGIHTINECIHFKVPMLILSGNRYDQNGCAVRVSKFGCGISDFEVSVTKTWIKSSIDQLLINPSYKQKIEQLSESYQASLKANVLEKEIEHFLLNASLITD